ncbi:hypothetical protein [Roseiarcus fermentans]|uniref:hypothetical protein n=1 Tax=Roseiarcus fermentans TaxID=1473586 RepID=UPI0011BE6363|nr:hypothetical protein [Roseiarcus fermentans]
MATYFLTRFGGLIETGQATKIIGLAKAFEIGFAVFTYGFLISAFYITVKNIIGNRLVAILITTIAGAVAIVMDEPSWRDRLTLARQSVLPDDDDMLWEMASGSGRPDECSKYLTAYPAGSHANDARKCIADNEIAKARARDAQDDAAWNKARKEGTIEACDVYLHDFPAGLHVVAARQCKNEIEEAEAGAEWAAQDDRAWKEAETKGSADACRDYLRVYLLGSHVSEAKKCVRDSEGNAGPAPEEIDEDGAAWSDARSAGTAEGCENYLRKHPSGSHLVEARECANKRCFMFNNNQECIDKSVTDGLNNKMISFKYTVNNCRYIQDTIKPQLKTRANMTSIFVANNGKAYFFYKQAESGVLAFLNEGWKTTQTARLLTSGTESKSVPVDVKTLATITNSEFIFAFEWDFQDKYPDGVSTSIHDTAYYRLRIVDGMSCFLTEARDRSYERTSEGIEDDYVCGPQVIQSKCTIVAGYPQ